jgi:hypothetical protein
MPRTPGTGCIPAAMDVIYLGLYRYATHAVKKIFHPGAERAEEGGMGARTPEEAAAGSLAVRVS